MQKKLKWSALSERCVVTVSTVDYCLHAARVNVTKLTTPKATFSRSNTKRYWNCSCKLVNVIIG